MLQEARDAHDVVEWLAKQPYCNGKVTMWGGSYAGYNQWAAAKEFPPHLKTIVPVASPHLGTDFPFDHQMAYSYDIQWLTLVSGRASQDKIFGDQAYWLSVFKRMYLEHRPFRELDRIAGMQSATFQEWLDHPANDAYWDRYNPTPKELAKIDLPILSITGQYDGDQPGALEHYRQHMRHASAEARARHYLVIGPWDHPGTRTPRAEVGGLKFGDASLVDLNKLHKDWYDWTLKSGAKPEFLRDAVAYYVVGAETWRYAPTLDAVTAEHRAWHLDSRGGSANDVFASGSLSPQAPTGEPDRYVYDPLDVSLAYLADDTSVPNLTDQRGELVNGGKTLIYHSAPFGAETELAGFFRLECWLALDQPDTDLVAAVYEVKPDGSVVFLASDRVRARYRRGTRQAVAVVPGEVERYVFDRFTFMARKLAKGSRVRLVIGAPDSPYAQKNYNAGGEVSAESGKEARVVTVTLLHDAEHPSALMVPFGRAH
jgi:putative CocE/NonD family hydrolase